MAALFGFLIIGAAIMAPIWFVLIAIHEFGHWLAGRLLGFRWMRVVIGPLEIAYTGARPAFLFSGQYTGGRVYLVPTHMRRLKLRLTIVSLAGIIANLMVAAAVATLYWHLPPRDQYGVWPAIFFVLYSLAAAIASAIPKRYNNQANDGMHIVQRWRKTWRPGGQEYEQYQSSVKETMRRLDRQDAMVALNLWIRGKRTMPRATTFECAIERDNTPLDAIGMHYAFYYAEARQDYEWSGKYIERAVSLLELIQPQYRSIILFDAAYHEGFHGRDFAKARQMFDEATALFITKDRKRWDSMTMACRAEAAALLAEGKRGEALEKARRSLAVMKKHRGPARNMVERLIERCEQESNAPSLTPAEQDS
jgi:hypothetical protein